MNSLGRFAGPIIDDPIDAPRRVRRIGKDSGDRRVPRDIEPRKDLVVFTDEPGQKKYSNRRKRTRLNKGGMFFNERDRHIVLLVAAHGWLSTPQLCGLLGGGIKPNALRHSMKRLVDHGLLYGKYLGFAGEVLYTVAPFGLRKTGAKGFNTGVIPRLQTIEHTDAITALHIFMVERQYADAIFMTERELYAAVASGELSPRITAAQPWTVGYSDFADWVPTTYTAKGHPKSKRPDGYLLSKRGDRLMPPQAVEIERTIKSRKGYYLDTLLAYAAAAQVGHISPMVTYFAPASIVAALTAELDGALTTHWPQHLRKIKVEVRDLDKFYTSYSASRGWIPRTA